VNARVDLPPPVATDHPLRAIQRLGTRASRNGLYVGVIAAILFHFTALESPRYSLIEMRLAVADMRGELHQYFWETYDVDMVPDEVKPTEEEETDDAEPEPPEPPDPKVVDPIQPETPREPIPEDAEAAEQDIYEEIPPAAAEAADVITADDSVKDLTSHTIVDKDGSRSSGGGYTSGKGTAKEPVKDRRAKADGKGAGKGAGEVRRTAKRKVDRSKPALPTSGSAWNDCGFPPQADLEQIDRAIATVSVTVAPDGRPLSARVVSDPGYGFGALAQACALTKRYSAALDSDGNPIAGSTPPIRVNFKR
jgi:periplasmic protein TonB